jgi:hypothetical protein
VYLGKEPFRKAFHKVIKHFSPMFATRRIAQTASRRLFSTQLATSTATLTDFNAFNPTEEHKGLSKFVMGRSAACCCPLFEAISTFLSTLMTKFQLDYTITHLLPSEDENKATDQLKSHSAESRADLLSDFS